MRTVLALALLLQAVAAPSAHAQVLYGTLVGSVSDSTKSPIPGAEAILTSATTGQSRRVSTNESGEYNFPALAQGTYNITIAKEGFQTYSVTGIEVGIDQIARLNATLNIGKVSERVEVSALAAQLQSDSSEVRDELTVKTLEDMPAPANRNFENLLIMIPGFSPPENVGSGAANPSRGLTFSVNGTTRNSNNVRIDGAAANNTWQFNVAGYVPALEAIEQVSVVTSTFDAAQGLAGGAGINVHVKSGGSQLHGSLFAYDVNGAFGSRSYFLPANQAKPKNLVEHYGGTLGGPIMKGKLFYFASWDGNFIRQTASSTVTVATDANRRGDFSNPARAIYDPATGLADASGRTLFPGNIIPAARLSPIALKMQQSVPLPNLAGTSANYFATGSYRVNRNTIDGKVDYKATSKFSTAVRFGMLKFDTMNPAAYGDNGAPLSSSGGRVGHIFGDVYNTTVNAVYIASPTLVLDSYWGFTRMNSSSEPPRLGENMGREYLGIPGTNGASREYSGWPWFDVTGYSIIGTAGTSAGGPIYYLDQQHQLALNGTWIKGKHSVRFGTEFGRPSLNHFETGGNSATSSPVGQFQFGGGTTVNKGGAASNQYNSYAGFLLGQPTMIAKDFLPFGNRVEDHSVTYTLYAQDSWRATGKLSVSYGVRWNFLPLPTRANHGLEEYNFATNQVMICGVAGNPATCDYKVGKKSFSPNLGIAYQLNPTTIIRVGAGINFDPAPMAYTNPMLGNYPEAMSLSLQGPNTYTAPFTLAQGIPAIVPPDISKGFVTLPNGYTVNTLTHNIKRDYVESWNVTIQKQFAAGFMGQVAYVATRGIDIPQQQNQNLGQLGGGAASQKFFPIFGTTSNLNWIAPLNHSYYDSLQSRLGRRFTNGVQVNASYTFSKSIAFCCDDAAYQALAIPLPQYLSLNKSLMPYDRTHHFTFSTVAQLPFGRGKRWLNQGRVMNAIVGGWQVNGLLVASSGRPFNVTASATSLNAPGVTTQRADLIKPDVAILGGTGPGQLWFDTSAFAPVTQVRFGTAGFEILRGPGSFNIDGSLFRTFPITEKIKLQFRGEAFNLTNTPHFAAPSGNASAAGFGVITSVLGTGREGIDQRMIRLGLRASF